TFTNAATLTTAGTRTISATDTLTSSITGTTGNITVAPAAASRVPNIAWTLSGTGGTPLSVNVTAQDQFGNTITNYLGTAHFTSSDGGVSTLPPTNSPSLHGALPIHTFTNAATLTTAGTRTISATDTLTSGITGTTGNITVNPAAAT